jgi:Asp-tRNA(Asn)/Glu-tRNA(Gln) amidotransferase A subunit family amidase
VADAVAMMEVLGQPLAADLFGPAEAVPPLAPVLDGRLRNLRIAYAPALCGLVPDADVAQRVAAGVRALAEVGAHVTEMKDPLSMHHSEVHRIWYGLYVVFAADTWRGALGEASLDSARSRLLSDSFRALAEKGLGMSAIDYVALNHERTRVLDAVDRIFEDYDLLVTATNAVTDLPHAPVGTQTFGPGEVGGAAVDPNMGWSMAYLFNLTGHPVASVPVGLNARGLPVGMQIVGARHRDRLVLAASADFERHMPWAETYRRLQ